jgi:hypothetical protein
MFFLIQSAEIFLTQTTTLNSFQVPTSAVFARCLGISGAESFASARSRMIIHTPKRN